jgi:hypothetical protein
LGSKHTKEAKAKIVATLLGRKLLEETLAKMSALRRSK